MNPVFFVIIAFVILGGIGIYSRVADYKNYIKEDEKEDLDKLEKIENEDMNKENSIETIPVENELQTVGEKVQAVLRAQSIPFELDEEGDILFEYHFNKYLLSQAKSDNYYCLSSSYGYEFSDKEWMDVLGFANNLHHRYRMIRMACFKKSFTFSVETLAFPGTDYKLLLGFSLDLIETALDDFGKFLRETEEGQGDPSSTIGFHEAQKQQEQQSEGGEGDKETQSDKREISISQSPSIGFNAPKYKP